jgi:hypothetical protein
MLYTIFLSHYDDVIGSSNFIFYFFLKKKADLKACTPY